MAQQQTLATALANLQNLPARITELQQKGTEFRQVLGTRLTDIKTRLEAIRQHLEQQGNPRQELLTLQNQIRDGAPTAMQLQTITNVIAQIDPTRLRQELTALEAEVASLEQTVGIRPPGAPGPPDAPGQGGGYDSSKQAGDERENEAILLSRKHISNKRHHKHNKIHKSSKKKHKKTKKKKKKKTKKKHH